jgi:hypothetical protein
MGMDYYIIPENETHCEDSFPDGLSFFFEQVGGYGESAEVEQVSRILQIDLSVFQETSLNEEAGFEDEDGAVYEGNEAQDIWHDTSAVAAIVDAFLAKIEAFPDYHEQVLHNPNPKQDDDLLMQILALSDKSEMVRQFEALENQPLFSYPPDYGYLSQGKIVEDLKTLRQTLACYKSNGVIQFKLLYM